MAFRTIKAKKYKGISEYFNQNSNDKETLAYYLSYRDETGSTKKIKLSSLDKIDALAEANKIRDNVAKKKDVFKTDKEALDRAIRTKNLTIEQLSEKYFVFTKNNKNIDKDKGIYNNRIKPFIGEESINKVKPSHLLNMQEKLISIPFKQIINEDGEKEDVYYSEKTINDTMKFLAAMFNYAERNGWLNMNPFKSDDFKHLKVSNEPGRVLSDNELEQMFTTFKEGNLEFELLPKPQIYLFTKIAYHTGARPAAILELKRQNIDFIQNKINLKAMKGGDSYQQTVKQEIMDLIKDWIDKFKLGYDDYLFFPQQSYERAKDEVERRSVKKKHNLYSTIAEIAKPYFDKQFNVGIPQSDKMNRISFTH